MSLCRHPPPPSLPSRHGCKDSPIRLIACGPYQTAAVTVTGELLFAGRSLFDLRALPDDTRGIKQCVALFFSGCSCVSIFLVVWLFGCLVVCLVVCAEHAWLSRFCAILFCLQATVDASTPCCAAACAHPAASGFFLRFTGARLFLQRGDWFRSFRFVATL